MAEAGGSGPGSSKADAVAAALRADIESGALAPGTPLVELALVARTGASRTPVREALRRLAAEGLVDVLPRQGARVSRVSLRSVRDLYEFRSLLEPEAHRQVARAATLDEGLRSAVRDLEAALVAIAERPPSAQRSRDFYGLTDRFDHLVIAATRNAHLRRTTGDLRAHTARLRTIAHTDPARLEVSLTEHLAMCRAVADGDGDAAAAACAHHLAQSLRTVVASLLRGADLDADVDALA